MSMPATWLDESVGPARTLDLPAGPVEVRERGEGRPLVFVHGLVLHAGFWRKVVPGLAGEYRCITPTLPLGGHRLPMNESADLSPTGIADLLADLLDQLDLDDAVLVGNDTGGAFSQILVTRNAGRVGALVLTPCDAFNHFLPWQFKSLQLLAHVPGTAWQVSRLLRLAALRRSALGFGLLTKHGLDDQVSASYLAGLHKSAGVRRDLTKVLKGINTRDTLAAAERFPNFTRPVLVAWAAEEKVFPMKDARRLAELFPSSQLEVIPDSRTYVPEDNPEALVELIRTFLS